MPDDPRFRYWDACCITSYINGYPDRLPDLDGILEEVRHSEGRVVLLTSTLSIVEVAFSIKEQQGRQLLPDEERRIDEMLADTATIRLAEPHELIMKAARGLIREAMTAKLSLRAADAIHLATAKHHQAIEFNTYDKKLLNPRYQGITGLVIQKPTAKEPSLGMVLPE